MRYLFCLFVFFVSPTFCQTKIPLYAEDIPNAIANSVTETEFEGNDGIKLVKDVSKPSLTAFLTSDRNEVAPAVIIFPGGGYAVEAYEDEGNRIAAAFNEAGISAFVVRYRLPSDKTMVIKSIGPLQDAQQAIRLVRMHATEWHLDPAKIGVMGFSAGGHVASTVGTHFEKVLIPDPEATSVRPDFMILIYPVISMTDSLGHRGSRNLLLGKDPARELIQLYSNELQVTALTPPTLLMHTGDDNVVDVDNSIRFYEALRHHGIPAEMHLYAKGNHGFILHIPTGQWMGPVITWVKKGNW